VSRPLSPAQLAILAAIEDGHDTVGALVAALEAAPANTTR